MQSAGCLHNELSASDTLAHPIDKAGLLDGKPISESREAHVQGSKSSRATKDTEDLQSIDDLGECRYHSIMVQPFSFDFSSCQRLSSVCLAIGRHR